MHYSDYIIYVDESGDHSLNPIDSEYPIFVLNFCIFHKNQYVNFVTPKLQTFKFRHFGHDAIIMREYNLRRQISPFVFLQSQPIRNKFMNELNTLIDEIEFTIVASVVQKPELARKNPIPKIHMS